LDDSLSFTKESFAGEFSLFVSGDFVDITMTTRVGGTYIWGKVSGDGHRLQAQ
jgi:hypothetical protein